MSHPKTFPILFVRGGGSTYLAELINQIDGFVCLREPKLTVDFFAPKNLSTLEALQTANDGKFAKVQRNRVEDCLWIGAKVKLYDQFDATLRAALIDSEAPTVVLHRRDLLRHTVGLCRKELSPRSVVWSAGHKLPPSVIPPELFMAQLEWVHQRNRELHDFRSQIPSERVLTVVYEDLCKAPVDELTRLTHFLGVDGLDITIREDLLPIKHTSVSWEIDVLNADELRYHFDQSQIEPVAF